LKNLEKIFVLIFITLLILSCKNDRIHENWSSDEIIAIGQTKDTTYWWCSIAPVEDKYSYRIGKWKFITKDSLKIAEGEYKTYQNWIWDKGGCPYEYFENSFDLDDWKFWDSDGDKIEPTRNLMRLIEFKVKNEEK
tara:strand:- start:1258 stop:1665 length:408 start_codon:yes stop_codon:yes gene_type:complete